MEGLNIFIGRKLVIATKHRKELVIAPILEEALGVSCVIPHNLDTDSFGTFTGEVKRTLDPLNAAIAKCKMAMELCDCDLAVASEGSFGAHPSIFFTGADDELLVLIDNKNKLEVTARELSVETNFNAMTIKSKRELMDFANRCGFPSHGIILRASPDNNLDIIKGITNWELLLTSYHLLQKKHKNVYAETDMRALFNPTRMKIIGNATKKLVERLCSLCPACNTPGFGVREVKYGLLCEACGYPTRSIRSHIYCCQKCNFSNEKKFPGGKQTEDPMFCDHCNP